MNSRKENTRTCCLCGSSPCKDPSINLYRFPKPGTQNAMRCELWAKYCYPNEDWSSPQFQNEMYAKHKMLCSKHFESTCFIEKKLFRTAVPGFKYCDRTELSPTTKDEESSLAASPLPPSSLQLPSSRPTHVPFGPLHHFPNPQSINMEDIIRYYNWKAVLDAATQSKGDDFIYNQLRLCNRHFMDCYHLPSRRLTKNSIPTLHLTGSDGNTAESLLYNELSVPISEPTIPTFMGNRLVFRRKYDPDVPICRACLTTKRKLYNIHETDVLDVYQRMSGTQVTEDDCLSKLLCSHCVTLLRKCNTFSQNCKEAAKALKEATFTNYLPEASKVQNLKFYRTNINHIDIVGENCVKMEINQDNDGDTMVDDTGVSEHMDIADEIEIKDVIKIRKKKPNVLDDENKLKEFEDSCNVDVHKLSSEEKLQDVLDRKSTPNYLNSPHRCELCFKGFLAANLLTNHFLMHHDPSLGSEVCEYCQFRYKTANDLSAHYTTRHTTKMSCRLCPKVSRNIFEAKKHHDVYHNGQKYTTCEHCGRGFRVQSTFLVHLRDEHPSELIWCNVCGDSFVLAETLDKHKQRRHRDLHLPVQCDRCDVQLVAEAALARHSLDGVCTGHTCLHCGQGYNDAMALRDHIIKTHRKTSNMLYPCPKCHKVYKQGAQLRDHLKYVHLKLNRKVICEICGKVVPNKNAMKVHLRVHTGERPYECPVCMKGFISKDTMMKHRNYVHSTARPYVCDRCPKSFKGKHNLTQHERAVHDNETTTASQTLLSLGLIL